ncbi:MAG: serine/threonine-protein kinase [Polyangiaceae bacterium]|jgi:serine/threonine-protein kinase
MSTPSDRGAATKAEEPRQAPGRAERKVERPGARPGGPASLVGVVLSGRYLIERVIGQGGMGAVYLAEHMHMHKRLAVKVLHGEMSRLPEVVARFEREAMAAAHIEHPNVASATDFGKLEDGSFFLVLEYVEGRSLREAIAEASLDCRSALHVARQMASGLSRAHALGIVHRDLKPENVMLVSREDDPNFVKVLDFGIAKVPVGELIGESKVSGQVLTQLGMVYGTPEYMAPEQALGEAVDARADLYALGAIMFEMFTGGRPYDHESKVTLLGMHVTAPVPRMTERAPDADIPAELDAIVTKLLAKDAAARFDSAKELIEELDRVTAQLTARGLDEPPAAARAPRPSGPRFSGAGAAPNLSVQGPSKLAPSSATSLQSLASLFGASLGQAVRGAPRWATRRMRVAIAAALVMSGLLFAHAARRATAPGASASAGAVVSSRAPRADPKTDDAVASAKANIEKGDFATAIDQLTTVEKSYPDRAEVHVGLEKAYTGVRNAREAMREAGLWLDSEPAGAADLKLQEDVRNAALFREAQEEAFQLLESKMGARGIDILYDVAFGASGHLYPQAAARAKRSLLMDQVRARASPALGVVLDLRESKGCEAKHALLQRARDQGDARLLPVLQQLTSVRGCGFLSAADCYPCMRKDELLAEAVSVIGQRAAKAP